MIIDKFCREIQPKSFAYFEKFKGDMHLIFITEVDEVKKRITYISITDKSDLRNRRNNPLTSPDYKNCDLGTCQISRANDMIITSDFKWENAIDFGTRTFAFIKDLVNGEQHLAYFGGHNGYYVSDRLERYLGSKFKLVFGKE